MRSRFARVPGIRLLLRSRSIARSYVARLPLRFLGASVVGVLGAMCASCTDKVALVDVVDASTDGPSRPPVCGPAEREARAIAGVPIGLGDARVIMARAGVVYALLVRPDGSGVLARTVGDVLREVATVGRDPIGLAVDDRYAYVIAKGTSEVLRVDGAGNVRSAPNQAATHLTVGRHGRAVWSTGDTIVAWDFQAGAPAMVVRKSDVTGLLHDENDLFVTTPGRLFRIRATDGAESAWAAACGEGIASISSDVVYCADGNTVFALSLATGASSPFATNQRGASTVVTSRGRVLWRTNRTESLGSVVWFAKDGLGVPSAISRADGATSLIAADGCTVYFLSDRTLFARSL